LGIQQDDMSDAQSVFMDLGPFIIVLVVGLVLLIVLMSLKVILCCFGHASLKKIDNKLKSYLFWTATLRYILESYLKMTLFSITLARAGFDWSSNLKKS
jgi:uncharacterized membrane protein